MLSPAFRSKQRRSIFKKFLRLFGLPDFSQIYLFSDGLWKKRSFSFSKDGEEIFDDVYSIYFNSRFLLLTSSFQSLRKNMDSRSKRIFIIGSGPSIAKQNLNVLKNEEVILLNGSCILIKQLALKEATLVISDDSFIQKRSRLLNEVLKYVQESGSKIRLCFSFRVLRAFLKEKILLPEGAKIFLFEELLPDVVVQSQASLNIYDYKQRIERNDGTMKIFSSFDKAGVFHCGSVMTVGIQIAAFLGYEEVYLLGFDIGNSNQPRFYEKEGDQVRSGLLADYETGILPFMLLASAWFMKNNRKIFNCSPSTLLPYEVVPYLDFGLFSNE